MGLVIPPPGTLQCLNKRAGRLLMQTMFDKRYCPVPLSRTALWAGWGAGSPGGGQRAHRGPPSKLTSPVLFLQWSQPRPSWWSLRQRRS